MDLDREPLSKDLDPDLGSAKKDLVDPQHCIVVSICT